MEKCPTTGRLHCQLYIRYNYAVAVSSVRKTFSPGHVELCAGTEEDNVKYCSKEESRIAGPWTLGVAAEPGKRKDIDIVREIVKSGGGMRAICDVATSFQALRGGELLLKYCERERDFVPEVYWWHGSTESGKSKLAFEEFKEHKLENERVWVSNKTLEWWEGYDAHAWVIVDDFRRDFCKFHELLRLFDRYPYRVMTKGGSRQLLARVIIVTCPWSPSQLYSSSHCAEDVQQLLRRITSVKLFGSEVPDPVAPNPVPHFRR